MKKHRIPPIIMILLLTAGCSEAQEKAAGEKTGSSAANASVHADSTTTEVSASWYTRLAEDSNYSLELASADGNRKAKEFLSRGEILEDTLVVGDYTRKFQESVTPEERIAVTMMCTESFSWESQLPPVHPNAFGSSGSCTGVTTFTAKEWSESLNSWSLTIDTEGEDNTYRIIVQKIGQK